MDGLDHHIDTEGPQSNGQIRLVSVQSGGLYPVGPFCEGRPDEMARYSVSRTPSTEQQTATGGSFLKDRKIIPPGQ
jgi:hypothetical protein